jgi:general secretion pathway protein A
MGQPELRDRLNNPKLRQLCQRITVRFHLDALSRRELADYIRHRLQVSGGKGSPHFTGPAIWRIYNYSNGVPRLVNALCDKALLAGYATQSHTINFSIVGRAIRELEGEIAL